jgi:phospholipid transport system substrate-binding protein
MKKNLTNILFGTFFLIFCTAIFAQDPPPLVVMKDVTSKTLAALQQNKASLHSNAVIHNIVDRVVVPYFDLPGVSRSVVGPNYWRQASNETRAQFISAFTSYVTDMYASALSSYSNEFITFKPMRSFDPTQSRVIIYSSLQRRNTSPVDLDYRLVKIGNTWKIYDFSVDGISMVQSYRAQFSDILQKGGLAELTKELQQRDKK